MAAITKERIEKLRGKGWSDARIARSVGVSRELIGHVGGRRQRDIRRIRRERIVSEAVAGVPIVELAKKHGLCRDYVTMMLVRSGVRHESRQARQERMRQETISAAADLAERGVPVNAYSYQRAGYGWLYERARSLFGGINGLRDALHAAGYGTAAKGGKRGSEEVMKRGERVTIGGIRWECVDKRRPKKGEWATIGVHAGDQAWLASPWLCAYQYAAPAIILRPVSVVRKKRKVRER